ncbi:aminoglycoside phosphotransferase family protein [Pedomonas mirosovicensis]|uniref:aminoglycoside phosphotransferase family protein n=1 Tax=Pedomonas mirosovicensis TaxID=2908641 RepID=UPI002169CB04|nr:phosphotransferase [Pedomonas mirosovicensis]MCH8684287.1 phosphotransferase [Pedomonas mirosovicensis]
MRLRQADKTAVLMIAPPGLELVEPFVAVGQYLAGLGLSVPTILGVDAKNGLVLLEDLGDLSFVAAIKAGHDEAELYAAATDVLARVHNEPVPDSLPVADGTHALPRYSNERMQREVDLVLEWYWPAVAGSPVQESVAAEWRAAWEAVWPLAWHDRPVLVQFDYHSPNLLWLPEREGLRHVGVLDFQDSLQAPAAYDVVSLLQDPRRDVAAGLEPVLIERYLAARPEIDPAAFRTAYAVLGAQRASRILGVFVRLWKRDGKPGYLAHQPRVWALLSRNLEHPALAPVKAWFDAHMPAEWRAARWAEAA